MQYHPSRQYLFVPPALSSLHIKPNSCQLVASYSESANQTGFTFSVSWTNEDSTAKIKTANDDDNDLVLSIRAPVDETSKFLSSVKHSTKGATSRENILCDGPCGRRYPPESMKVLGRCGHFLCDVCYGLVYNDDGTKGCSNFGCVFATLYEYLPEDYARKAYENHIMARQRARESSRSKEGIVEPSPRSSRGSDHSTRHLPRNRTPRSLTPRSLRARKVGSSCSHKRANWNPSVSQSSRTPLEDDPSYQLHRRSYACSPSSDPSNRRRRVLDEIFSDMTLTSSNVEGPTSEFELLNIRLMIFEPGPFKTIKRVHISREMSAALTVKEAIDELMDRRNGNIRHECPSRLYFCSGSTTDGLRRITVEEFETAHLWQYPARNSVLHFVLDTVGYLKGTD